MDSLEINPCSCCQIIYNKGGKNVQRRKDSLFKTEFQENRTATYTRMRLENLLTPYTEVNSKWIKHLNMKTPRREYKQNIL